MIKSFCDLNSKEKDKLLIFMNKKEYVSLSDMENMFNTKAYNYGEGIAIVFDDNQVLGVGRAILKEIPITGIAYIYSLDILESYSDKKYIIESLIKKLYLICDKNNADEILLGFRKEETMEIIKKLGLKVSYSAKIMEIDDKTLKEDTLKLEELDDENKFEYMDLYNRSFSQMPHGASLDENELNEYLNESYTGNHYFIVLNGDEKIGVMNVYVEANNATFDIGLSKEFRGKGYGKRLLETAIQFLVEQKIENIYLIVIEVNKIAYNMYKKRGFKEKEVLSYWVKLKDKEKNISLNINL
ncbi:GNAT family N-acetyltransferase [Clostridium sp. Ade.TY]|uniref:GNAT family N-acetyltransferase n=1 Tax=Clostridium sp. Ade.TY TaxID=1391647 RepID=UPI0003FC81AA|nr:GNAT family N-acetyltransferase [Clostridium sp. Ade.TY]